ncbi:hypothetical protein KQH60_10180 [Mycetohabitans sp. B8]|uniref:hypothetical protein n=1 Tax=Mycetohabitans sp. B8 TaxID=2841845 RepID=UPI001F202231|nr:hypothetical protein [Mycetohabitans sp. B8]MCG1042882.1 hypothetical protein [Mycetohabitans sp. B8]
MTNAVPAAQRSTVQRDLDALHTTVERPSAALNNKKRWQQVQWVEKRRYIDLMV